MSAAPGPSEYRRGLSCMRGSSRNRKSSAGCSDCSERMGFRLSVAAASRVGGLGVIA